MQYRDTCHACGKTFRSAIAEARHRHNFPVLCIRNKRFKRFCEEIEMERDIREGEALSLPVSK